VALHLIHRYLGCTAMNELNEAATLAFGLSKLYETKAARSTPSSTPNDRTNPMSPAPYTSDR
jgi:hypothetical protein